MTPDLTLGGETPKHLTDHWPVAAGHEIPVEEWEKVKAVAEKALPMTLMAPAFTPNETSVAYPGAGGRKDSGLRRAVPGDDVWVIHTIECPLRSGYAVSISQWGATSPTQASWTIATDPSTVCRFVPMERAAWHATWANKYWPGAEQAGYAAFSRSTWLTTDGLTSIARLARALVARGISVGAIRRLTDAEVARRKAGDLTPLKGLVSHAQIQPADRTDPGAGYPWDVLMDFLRQFHPDSAAPPSDYTQEDFMPALSDAQQTAMFNRIMGGIPGGSAEGRTGPDGNPARILDSGDGDYLRLTIEALTAAVGTLANGQGLNPDLVVNVLREEVRAALARAGSALGDVS